MTDHMTRSLAFLTVACLFGALLSCSNGGGTTDAAADAGTDGANDAGQLHGDAADGGSVDDGKADVPPVELPPVFINELSAKGEAIGDWNVSGSDWAELYNGSSEDIDLKSWRVIDSKTKGFDVAMALPPGTMIAANGYLVVFFNHDGEGSPVLDKKLGSDEALSIYHPTGALVDMVNWEPADIVPDKSWGRTPDGGDVFVVFDKPTPNATNK